MNMKQVGRHYFDPTRKITVPQHKLEVWPGFETSILQLENNVMLCTNTMHKLMNVETVLSFLLELQRSRNVNPGNYRNVVTRNLIGRTVMTLYERSVISFYFVELLLSNY